MLIGKLIQGTLVRSTVGLIFICRNYIYAFTLQFHVWMFQTVSGMFYTGGFIVHAKGIPA